jgi:hypothetical protein
MGFFQKIFKKENNNVLYVQVVDKVDDDLILTKIGKSDGKQIIININDIPENTFKCNAYKITIEPIEHTFEHPCEEWKKYYRPEIADIEGRKQRMKIMFGLDKDGEEE